MEEILRGGRLGIDTNGIAGSSEIDRVDGDDTYDVELFRAEIGYDYRGIGVRDFSDDCAVDLDIISMGGLAVVRGLPV